MLSCSASPYRLTPERLGPYGQRLLGHRWNIAGLGTIYGLSQVHNDVIMDAVIVSRLLADEDGIAGSPFKIGRAVEDVAEHPSNLVCDLQRLEGAVRQQNPDTFRRAARAVRQKIERHGLLEVFKKHERLLACLNNRLRLQQDLMDPSGRVILDGRERLFRCGTIRPDVFNRAGTIVSAIQYLQAAGVDRSDHPLFFKIGTEKGYFNYDWNGHNDMAQERQYVRTLAQRVANHALRRGVATVIDFEGTRFEPNRKECDPAMPAQPDVALSFDLINREDEAGRGFPFDISAHADINISVTQGLGVTAAP